MTIQRSDYGCGDNSCIFGSPGGMATNGGCRCFEDLPRTPDGRATRRRISLGILELRSRVTAAAERENVLVEALEKAKAVLTDERIGTIDYMEGSKIYRDFELCADEIDAALALVKE